MDRITKTHRSWNMSRIQGRNTFPELAVRKVLYSKGLRYRLHYRLAGKPDIVFLGKKIAIFINGCFWHKHKGCKNFVYPRTNADFWKQKIDGNVKRDMINYAKLKEEGWKILIVWECEIEDNFDITVNMLLREINYGN